MRVGRSARIASLGLAVLAVTACRKQRPAQEQSERERPTVEAPREAGSGARMELGIDDRWLVVDELEQLLTGSLEAELLEVPGLRHLTSEARDGRVRVVLELDALGVETRRAVLGRLARIDTSLPGKVESPQLLRMGGPGPMPSVRWVVESETLGPRAMMAIHGDLVESSQGVVGVLGLDACARRERVVVELDRDALIKFAVDPREVERALGKAMFGRTLELDALGAVEVTGAGDVAILLSSLAAIRVELDDPECVALSAAGVAASATLTLDDDEARARVEAFLDEEARALPEGARLRRFAPDDALVELSVVPGRALEDAAGLIRGALAHEQRPWLLEVGVEAEPCVGAGVRARLTLAGRERPSAELIAALRGTPGVAQVEVGGSLPRRLWLLGSDPEGLHELAEQRAAELRRLPGLVEVAVYADAPRPQVQVEFDRNKLAALGLDHVDAAKQLAIARGLELGDSIDSDRSTRLLVLRQAGAHAGVEALREVVLLADGRGVPLDAVAGISIGPGPDRICRRDGQRGIMLGLRVEDPARWPELEPGIQLELPPGYRWAWEN